MLLPLVLRLQSGGEAVLLCFPEWCKERLLADSTPYPVLGVFLGQTEKNWLVYGFPTDPILFCRPEAFYFV